MPGKPYLPHPPLLLDRRPRDGQWALSKLLSLGVGETGTDN